MRICQVHNLHKFGGGSETVVETTVTLLRQKGHDVILATRDNRELIRGLTGKIRAFFYGIYCPDGRRFIRNIIREHAPDIVHVHELFPFFSPWALIECKRAGIPVVMTCHDYRLTCPVVTHERKGKVCELCMYGHEYWCVINNCRGNMLESFAYALRNYVARYFRLFLDNVNVFIALTEFAKRRLMALGIKGDCITVIPNAVCVPDSTSDPSCGSYVAYVGRLSSEKGIEILLSATERLPELCLQLAGNGPDMPKLVIKAPINAHFLGYIDRPRMTEFYEKARFIVLPTRWFEGCPMVLIEAMSYGLPVIASRVGGLSEIVDDGVTGFLFEAGNVEELTSKMKLLWQDKDLCCQMGQAAREKAIREYHEDVYYRRLMTVYDYVLSLSISKSN